MLKQNGRYNAYDIYECILLNENSRFLMEVSLNSPPGQNDRHFADGVFICIFVNEKFCILIKISLKFVPWDIEFPNYYVNIQLPS